MATKRKRKLSGAAKASHLMKRGRKKLRAFVRSQANRGRRKNATLKYRGYTIQKRGKLFTVVSRGEVLDESTSLAAAKIWIDHFAYGDSKFEDSHPGYGYESDNPKRRRRKKNPVRVGAQVVGSGTGWIKAKAVKVRKVKGKGYVVDVKR